jgi:cellulose synthase/poly-beta-1,6-N-acetylglucosamine synthase-like glycosyltransferase
MFAWQVLRLLVLAAQIWIALPILYLCTLSIAAILTTHRRKAQYSQSTLGEEPSSVHFAILIPAHNEEGIIDSLLASLAGLAYPKDQYGVYVVAEPLPGGLRMRHSRRSRLAYHLPRKFDTLGAA